jgi:hypothetical protein
MLSLTAMFELNVMWVISCLDVVAALCSVILRTQLERSEQTEKWKETKQIRVEFHCFTVHFNSLYITVQLRHLFVLKH